MSVHPSSRRTVVGGAVTAAAAAGAVAASGAGRTSYTPAHYRGGRLLRARDQHLVRRFSYGRGPLRMLGFTHPNGAADGRAVTRADLSHLPHHPATAQRVARKLASPSA